MCTTGDLFINIYITTLYVSTMGYDNKLNNLNKFYLNYYNTFSHDNIDDNTTTSKHNLHYVNESVTSIKLINVKSKIYQFF